MNPAKIYLTTVIGSAILGYSMALGSGDLDVVESTFILLLLLASVAAIGCVWCLP